MKVLFVEDSLTDAELAVRELKAAGLTFETMRVDTREAHVAALHQFKPDIVITDYSMPQFDGMQALMLSLKENPQRPVIVLTTSLNESVAVACMKAGAIDYVLKEQMSRLPFAVAEALGKNRLVLEKQAALKDLITSEERFRILADMAPVGIYLADKGGHYLYTNKLCNRMLGFSGRKPLGDEWFETVFSADRESVLEGWRESIAKQQAWSCEFRFEHGDGAIIWVNALTSPLLDQNSQISGFVGVFADITQRKSMEEDLRRAKTRAEESSLATRRFFSMMSHELRTPLNPIIGFIELLAMSPNLTDEQRRWLNIVLERGIDLNNLINRVLDLARIEAEEMPLESKSVVLRSLVEDMTILYKTAVEERGLRLQSSVAAHLPESFVTDSQRIRQILTNLLDNALKFTQSGEITIDVGAALPDELSQQPGRDECGIRFCVRDTGIGIASEKQAAIFEPFRQAEISHVVEFGGSGLGLAIVTSLVKLMGGKIWVESALGVGSSFYFSIIAKSVVSDAVARPKTQPVKAQSHRSLKVLVVDDDLGSREVASELLRRRGDVVVQVKDGIEALAQIEAQVFDVVLMDIRMPKLDGIEATRRVRERDVVLGRHTNIIALTACALAEDRNECLASGMDSYLSKPIIARGLYAAIDALLT
jgi:PAS domain S-box-containing protein